MEVFNLHTMKPEEGAGSPLLADPACGSGALDLRRRSRRARGADFARGRLREEEGRLFGGLDLLERRFGAPREKGRPRPDHPWRKTIVNSLARCGFRAARGFFACFGVFARKVRRRDFDTWLRRGLRGMRL